SIGRVILGEDAGTIALPQRYLSTGHPPFGYYQVCQNGAIMDSPSLPTRVVAAVYYPSFDRDQRVPTPNPLNITRGPFPVLLYAHALRVLTNCDQPTQRDFTTVEFLLRHVASYGCVCVAPDLSWVPPDHGQEETIQQALNLRSYVLFDYYQYLATLNATLFAHQLDLSRVVLVGHSTGGGAVPLVGSLLQANLSLQSLSYALIPPSYPTTPPTLFVSPSTRNLLALRGERAMVWFGVDPAGAYGAGGNPKTLVTIGGANHCGYTSLCDANNNCDGFGVSGTITRDDQQQVGAAYLAA